MEISTKGPVFVKRLSTGLMATALILAPALSNQGFVAYLTKGRAYAQTVTTYTHDDNGNMLSRTIGSNTDTFTYDAENRLVSANIQSGPTPGMSSYTYDDNGLRTSATSASATTSFLLDKNRNYAQVVLERTGSTFVDYTYGHRLISQNRTGLGSRFYLSDGQFSTRQLISQTSLLTDTYTYDAFGELLSSAGTTTNNYRYTGEQFDPNSTFYYLRARYYDPATGRFSVTDPFDGRVTAPLSMHRYLYADADPINKIDPSGQFGVFVVLGAAFVVLELIGALSALGGVVSALNSFARSRVEGRTNRFLYKPCGSWQLEIGAGFGGGTAVIAEDPVITFKNPPNQGRRFSLSFRSVGAGGAWDKEGDAIPFTTYKNQRRQLSAFVGEGIFLTGPEVKAPGYGYSLLGSQLLLPDQSVVYQNAGGGNEVPTKFAEAQLLSFTAVQFIGLDASPGYLTEKGLACSVPPDPNN